MNYNNQLKQKGQQKKKIKNENCHYEKIKEN